MKPALRVDVEWSYGNERPLETYLQRQEHACFAQTTALFVAILKHFEHRSHLFSAVYCFILNYVKSILRSSINFDDAMTRVGRVRRDDEEAQSILVQDELVESQWRLLSL